MSLSNPFQQALSLYAAPAGGGVITQTINVSNSTEVVITLPANTYQFTVTISSYTQSGLSPSFNWQLGNDSTYYTSTYYQDGALGANSYFYTSYDDGTVGSIILYPKLATVCMSSFKVTAGGSWTQSNGMLKKTGDVTRIKFFVDLGSTIDTAVFEVISYVS